MPDLRRPPLVAAALLAALPAAALPALAQEAPADPAPVLAVELNTAAPQGDACRLTFVVENGLGADLDAAVIETVLFDREGAVILFTLFDFGAVPAGRPRVRQFDVAGTECGRIGRVLLNGVHACRGAGIAPGDCEAALRWSSRTDVEVIG